MEKIKEVSVDNLKERKALVERMDLYLSTLTTDPWQERLKDEDQVGGMKEFKEYTPIDIPVQVVNE